MKTTLRAFAIALFLTAIISSHSYSQGRVVINEFMSWSGCNTTSEFIELMNFGPGPMNIGCYIVTNGTYSVTIPPNTILQPREYYVISGQNSLPMPCGNQDSTVRVDLNWTNCNCSNVPIPTTGDGFFKNGGSSNEKLVLLTPTLDVVDAVSRSLPATASAFIVPASVATGCSGMGFDLDNMGISYETIGNSTGIDNSFARMVDGDCAWVKTTAISAGAPNKTDQSSSMDYQFNTLSASNCETYTGSISIEVGGLDPSSLFPMHYTLAFDADSNGVFTEGDQYVYGTDFNPTSIDIDNLSYGRHRITVGSSSQCNLKNFDFFIFNCYGVLLPLKVIDFRLVNSTSSNRLFNFIVSEYESLKEVVLEGNNGSGYQTVNRIIGPFTSGDLNITAPLSDHKTYRLRLKDKYDRIIYSKELIASLPANQSFHAWYDPSMREIKVALTASSKEQIITTIYSNTGVPIKETKSLLEVGSNQYAVSLQGYTAGIYYMVIQGEKGIARKSSFFIP